MPLSWIVNASAPEPQTSSSCGSATFDSWVSAVQIVPADVELYFKRLSAAFELGIDDKFAKANGNAMVPRYTEIRNGVKRTRVRELAQEVMSFANAYLG